MKNGLEIRLTDGTHTIVGRGSDSSTKTFCFAEGEKISSLKVWEDTTVTIKVADVVESSGRLIRIVILMLIARRTVILMNMT